MTRYKIVVSDTAKKDLKQFSFIIKTQYKASVTSFKYIQGLLNEIQKLSLSAPS